MFLPTFLLKMRFVIEKVIAKRFGIIAVVGVVAVPNVALAAGFEFLKREFRAEHGVIVVSDRVDDAVIVR